MSTTTSHAVTNDRVRSLLELSGWLGLGVSGLFVALVVASNDAIIPIDVVELSEWTMLTLVFFVTCSVITLLSGDPLERFETWMPTLGGLLVLVQWGTPTAMVLAGGQRVTMVSVIALGLFGLFSIVIGAITVSAFVGYQQTGRTRWQP